ncbi:M48 family metalloprotease [Natronobacterium gregoryi]|uniref:Heat shock protein HtpX n=2 Tax=Natronobacterium gregoryi TaxID=44930 RepID=L0AMN5_NATGS|nr:M48 family metalloprotease [Natronobacterium gregoryi]AFZ74719.1 Zn-dependent protease with chaperone function [Natronobacterium gregoryi SP2]ELY73474.1 heat shock protein HtpX [Natronobacterium gregoryi SP2]PLK20963.1 peptidase M48 [Natronobacterium gregoryi SP2]SFJ04139.1 heat shock protein HtpX [Natronobacterium gregoryi]
MPSSSLELQGRMVAALLALVVVTVCFLAGVWAVFYGVFLFLEIQSATYFAFVVTTATLLSIGYLEYTHLETIERLAGAHPVDEETAPELYRQTTRVAAQLDVPVPTIAVSDRDTPEALAVGFRPANVHLVLSTGTIRALDDDELEAVIAHELAHVKNRDAMVVTVVSLPVVLAEGLGSRLGEVENPGWAGVVIVPLVFLSTVVWIVGRSITARLSRARERAADRAAAAVIGSPAVLASALQRLDREIDDTPNRDLREASGVSSLSILPLEPKELEKVMLGPDGDREPSYWWLRTRLHRLGRWLFTTHPPTEDRIDSLRGLERED